LPMDLQAKLLRVLQERELQRLGSSETIRLDIRIVAATNCDLADRMEQGRFREDLYYRLNVVPLHLPPLRQRPGDIPELADKPCIVRKKDGGFNYATSDIATVDYRINDLKRDTVWYIVGAPQTLHFKEIFEVARREGYTADFRHIPFGSILGKDRKLMKTRSGDNVPLREVLDEGRAGDNVGLLLRGVEKDDVERGQVLAKPGSIKPHTKFKGTVYVLSKEEGGRHTPFFNGYRPQFYFRTTDVTGSAKLPEGTEMVMPGDNIALEVTLHTPVAMEKGLRFAIREGGRTVGAGTIAEIIK